MDERNRNLDKNLDKELEQIKFNIKSLEKTYLKIKPRLDDYKQGKRVELAIDSIKDFVYEELYMNRVLDKLKCKSWLTSDVEEDEDGNYCISNSIFCKFCRFCSITKFI